MQGQSDATEEKERGLRSFFLQNLSIFSAIANKHAWAKSPYHHFDLHSGSGFNEAVRVIGSPIVFQRAAKSIVKENYRLFCIDKDESSVVALSGRLKSDQLAYPFLGDNSELAKMIPRVIARQGLDPAWTFGSILLDPNNQSREQTPWAELVRVCSVCPRLDVVFNYPATAMKRVRCAFGDRHPDFVNLEQLPGMFGREHVYIRDPIGAHQFTLIVARNRRYSNPGPRFHEWDSPRGRRARKLAVLTEKERRILDGQRELFS